MTYDEQVNDIRRWRALHPVAWHVAGQAVNRPPEMILDACNCFLCVFICSTIEAAERVFMGCRRLWKRQGEIKLTAVDALLVYVVAMTRKRT